MKRTEMLKKLEVILDDAPALLSKQAEYILFELEKMGMKPPCVGNDECQALMQVYIDPSFNMWDEDFHKDEKLAAALKRRLNRR